MNTQIHADLVAARAAIADPAKWAKGDYWKNSNGFAVQYPEQICSMCALGAVLCATGAESAIRGFNGRASAVDIALEAELPETYSSVPEFNDDEDTTHADILNLFDCAIAKQELIIQRELASGE